MLLVREVMHLTASIFGGLSMLLALAYALAG